MLQSVPGYIHHTGFHCGSSAVRSMMEFFGHKISEPLALGLGQGLFVCYIHGDSLNPTNAIMPRQLYLEEHAFRGLGCDVTVRETKDPQMAWKWIEKEMAEGRPAMIQVDIAGLKYFGTNTSFAGHKVIACGYDAKSKRVLISDNEFENLQEVTFEELAGARSAFQPPFELNNNWFQIQVPETPVDPEKAVPAALKGQVELLLGGPEYFGLSALPLWADSLNRWKSAKDWSWSARFTYQTIEKRGTGGGGFRKQYAAFLEEVKSSCPLIEKEGLDEIIAESAKNWTEIALALKAISEKSKPEGYPDIRPKILKIYDLESRFCKVVQENL